MSARIRGGLLDIFAGAKCWYFW